MVNEFSRLIKPKPAAPKFDAKKAKQLAGLLSKSKHVTIDGLDYILPRCGTVPFIMKIIEELNGKKGQAGE
ncbi:hypothetical protein SOASR030_01700 [Leminorella grimontii]|uniref:Uncharacterized protein n=1 Tax=Leminorella grimontii TaxID=82981 RepID=A0AAV5MW42_9GAMM|nr:hypothetical protein [Leminorella grimontii]GKX54058.1 hypothetical protein SOASR030_01700 [Leminorella grimontii]VFS60176.1 Uncharacterised protein [Leminorella grimontii]